MDFLNNTLYREDVDSSCKNIQEIQKLYETRIFITGATGLVGSFLVDILRHLNKEYETHIQIYAVSRKIEKLEARFGKQDSYLKYVVGDICDNLDFDTPVDYVIHAAANSYPALFREDPTGTIIKSVEGTRRVLEISKKCGVKKFLFVSSGEVYGQYKTDEVGHRENENGVVDILSLRSCYPLGKQIAENLCICYGEQYHLPIVIARLCHTFGPNALDSDNRAHMQFIRSAALNNNVVLKSEGLQERSYLYIADSASAIFSVLLCGEVNQAYNVSSLEKLTIRKFAKICATLSKKNVYMQLPTNEEYMERSPIERQILDGSRLRALGWNANFSIKKGILHSIEILKDIGKV